MSDNDLTQQKICTATLQLLLRQGIKKTNLEEVAHHAGVTRITVYRYFADKQALVEAALMSIPQMLEQLADDLEHGPALALEQGLERVGGVFAHLQHGDAPALIDETRRVYPAMWDIFHQRRTAAIQRVFDHLLAQLEAQGMLREGLSRAVIETFFLTSVVNVLKDPRLVALGLSANEIYRTVQSIFLHGILKEGEK